MFIVADLVSLSKQCSADPDEISHFLAFHLDVHFQSTPLHVYPVHNGLVLYFIGYF